MNRLRVFLAVGVTLVFTAMSAGALTPVVIYPRTLTGMEHSGLISLQYLTGVLGYGTNAIYGGPIPLSPSAGTARTNLYPGSYRITIAGYAKSFDVFVPDQATEINLSDQQYARQGIVQYFYYWLTNAAGAGGGSLTNLAAGTNITIYQNNGTNYVAGKTDTNMWNALFTAGTNPLYSAFYPLSNPSSYVTASVTNPLYTTFYPLSGNPSSFVTATVTNPLYTTFYPLSNPSSYVTASVTNPLYTTFYPLSGNPSSFLTSVAEGNLALTDVTTANASTTKHGFVKKLPNDATVFLDGTGNFSTPAGSGSSLTNLAAISNATVVVINGTNFIGADVSHTEVSNATNGLSGVLVTRITAATNDLSGVLVTRNTASTNDLSGVLVTRITAATNDLNTTLQAEITQATNNLDATKLYGTIAGGRFPATLPAVSGVNLTALNASELTSGTVPAARQPALSGDVTSSAGSTATTIAAGAVTYSKMQNVSATSRVLGRVTAGAGSPEEMTLSQVLDLVGSTAQGDILYRGASGWARLGAGTSGQFLKTFGTGANPAWGTLAGGGDMLAANNLSDVANAATARANLGADFAGNITSGTLSLARGGLGASLSAPGTSKFFGYDVTDAASSLFSFGSTLGYTHSTHTLDVVSAPALTNSTGKFYFTGGIWTTTNNVSISSLINLNADGTAAFNRGLNVTGQFDANGTFDVWPDGSFSNLNLSVIADGTLSIAAGNVKLEPNGAGTFLGQITAPSMTIGGTTLTVDSTSFVLSKAVTFPDNIRQIFNPGATTPGFNFGSIAGDPSAPAAGDAWYDSSADAFRFRLAASTFTVGSGGSGSAEPWVTIGHTSGSSAERALGVNTNLTMTDGGANGAVTLDTAQPLTTNSLPYFLREGVGNTNASAHPLWVEAPSLGTTPDKGIYLNNPTAAAAGAQQDSPPIYQRGSGWKTTATAASKSVEFRNYVAPVQGSTAPTGNWILEASIDGGAFGGQFTFGSDGSFAAAGSGVGALIFQDSDHSNTGTITAPTDFTANRVFTLPNADGTIALADDTAFASSWNGVTTKVPTQNAVYDWIHTFDTDDDGKVNVLDQAAGIPQTDASGVIGTPITTHSGLVAVVTDLNSATRTATGLTYDASAAGNVLKLKGYLYLKNFDNITGAKPNNTNDYTASTFMKPVFLNGTAATANFIQFQLQVPTDFDTSVDPKIIITDKLTAADTGVRRYIVSTISPAASAAYDGTVGTAINVDIAADASGASGDVEQSSQVTLTGWGAALTPGRHWVIQIGRDGNSGTDTSTVDSMFSIAELEYGKTQ